MKLRFTLSGLVIATVEADCVPQIGAEVIIRTTIAKKGLTPGSLLQFKVSSEFPPIYDYSAIPVEVSIDVNDYEVLQKVQSID